MDQAIGVVIVVAVAGGYLYLNYFVATRVAGFIADRFSKDNDDEVITHDKIEEWDQVRFSPVTRADQRFKYSFFLVMLPLLVYLNYKFMDKIWAALEFIATKLASFAAQFL